MITLVCPAVSEKWYRNFGDFMLGPYGSNGENTGISVSFDSKARSMSEIRGPYHENGVNHVQVDGTLTYQPTFTGAKEAPTFQFPDRMEVPCTSSAFGKTTKYPSLGIISGSAVVKMAFSSNHQMVTQTAFFLSGESFTSYEVSGYLSDPTKVQSFVKRDYKRSLTVPLTMDIVNTIPAYGWMAVPTGFNTSSRVSAAAILALWGKITPSTAVSRSTFPIYNVEPQVSSPGLYPAVMRGQIEMLVGDVRKDESPIEPMHYGDLAMKASEGVNAVNINMIAFLKDLRHPMEMIPKLQNLAKLKTLSKNYLTVIYGILPTISDLTKIAAAFRKKGPYMDKNGFSTYSAGFSDSKVSGNSTHTLEQHIKLAIDDEDNRFEMLSGQLESLGILPTCENLWDLLPYSFVIDWFVNVGEYLQRVDSQSRLARLNIRYATLSSKYTTETVYTATVGSPYNGSIKSVHYQRWVSDQCPVPPLSLTTPNQPSSHWLEAGALIISGAKR